MCRLASESTGAVIFWLGKSADCSEFYTTRMTTYYPKQKVSNEIDPGNPNNKLRLTLIPGIGYTNTFGIAVMASQLLAAKMDKAQVSVIYKFIPGLRGLLFVVYKKLRLI